MLNLSDAEMANVLRPKAGRLDSPSNRYAGDWSRCQETYFRPLQEEADYADVPSEETECLPDGKGETRDQDRPAEVEEEEEEEHVALMEVTERERFAEMAVEAETQVELEEEEEVV